MILHREITKLCNLSSECIYCLVRRESNRYRRGNGIEKGPESCFFFLIAKIGNSTAGNKFPYFFLSAVQKYMIILYIQIGRAHV